MATPMQPMLMTSRARAKELEPTAEPTLLEIKGLKTHFKTDEGWLHAVDGVDISIDRGETVCVVGESGCGKTVTAMTVLKLLPMPPGRIAGGQVLWKGRDLVTASNEEMRRVRAKEIAIVFQEPMTSLNPVYTVGEQIAESVRLHEGLGRKAALERAVEMLALVRIPTPERRVGDYPHQFSGGMRQRVMIAIALACNPQLLIADEPTTALDVTIQAQILDLLAELKERLGMAIMLITHAMGVVAEVAQRVVVMYAGQVVEEASVEALFAQPRHPYTQGLIRSIPRIDTAALHRVRLEQIPGTVPKLIDPAEGCRFAPRCKYATPACVAATPVLREPVPGHRVRCIFDEFPASAAAVPAAAVPTVSAPTVSAPTVSS
jgi:peptide/nickel transport system ATP-binding protein